MKKNLFTITAGFLLFLGLQACCSFCKKDCTNEQTDNSGNNPPNEIVNNRSIAEIEVIEILPQPEEQFNVKGTIRSVEDDPAYESIAEVGQEITLKPNFVLDEDLQIVENEWNEDLRALRSLTAGDSFKAEIFYNKDGWFIRKIIK